MFSYLLSPNLSVTFGKIILGALIVNVQKEYIVTQSRQKNAVPALKIYSGSDYIS